jgi:Sec-independent protein translocase protein TatA
MSVYARLAALIVVVAALAAAAWKLQTMLNQADARGFQRAVSEMAAKALQESQAKARETQRRLELQDANQRAQDAEVERLRAAAARADAAADRVRTQSAAAAREWAGRLADSPTAEDLAAAGEAVRVCTELLGRADRRAGILARYSDAARTAGLKCEADYDSLNPQLSPPRPASASAGSP